MARSATHQITAIERTYARALLELADESGQLDTVAQEMEDLRGLFESDPSLRRPLGTRVLSVRERGGLIERVFKGRVSDLTFRFLMVLNSKDRLDLLGGITATFAALLEEKRGRVTVIAATAEPMPPAQAEQIARRLGETLGKTVVLEAGVDPSLIGGLRIRVGDQVIDGSVAAQLRLMRQKMIEAGREKARVAAGG